MARDLHTFIVTVRETVDRTAAELDRRAAELLGKPADSFTAADFETLRANPAILALFAEYERAEAHLQMLEQEAAREAVDTESLLAQAELDEDIQGGD